MAIMHTNPPPRFPNGTRLKRAVMWDDIEELAKTNPALKSAMDDLMVIYRLSSGPK